MQTPLTAVLKTEKLETVAEVEIPLERFPDMIWVGAPLSPREFFRIGITDKRAVYREGTSYRIPAAPSDPSTAPVQDTAKP